MSDLSVNGAAAATHLAKINAAVEATWETVDGPPMAYFEWRRRQGLDGRGEYVQWSFAGPMVDCRLEPFFPTAPRAEIVPEVFLHVLADYVREGNVRGFFTEPSVKDGKYNSLPVPVLPETHRLVWRTRPELEWQEAVGRWAFYCRFCFMPKDAWFLEPEAADVHP